MRIRPKKAKKKNIDILNFFTHNLSKKEVQYFVGTCAGKVVVEGTYVYLPSG